MFGLIPTLPTFNELAASSTSYTAGIFTDVMPLALMGVGLVIGGIVLAWIGRKVITAVKAAIGKRRGRRR